MIHLQHVLALVKKEILIEWRTLYAFVSVLLYVFCTVFTIYMMIGQTDDETFNALFWVAQLFIIVNAITKSFHFDNAQRVKYYYTLFEPWKFILSKIIYNLLLIAFLGLLTLSVFTVFLSHELKYWSLYYVYTLLGTSCLSVLFTFLSALSSHAQQGAAMTAILGIPLSIPLLMIIDKVAKTAIDGSIQDSKLQLILLLVAFEVLLLILSLVLYPFLWKEA